METVQFYTSTGIINKGRFNLGGGGAEGDWYQFGGLNLRTINTTIIYSLFSAHLQSFTLIP